MARSPDKQYIRTIIVNHVPSASSFNRKCRRPGKDWSHGGQVGIGQVRRIKVGIVGTVVVDCAILLLLLEAPSKVLYGRRELQVGIGNATELVVTCIKRKPIVGILKGLFELN